MKFSACWITKNEEKNIARSLGSVKNAVDELVVVDTGSSDDTVKISKNLGARVETFVWIGDFSAAKNYAISQTTGEIIIFLDADEWFEPALTAADRKEIERMFVSQSDLEAMQLPRYNLDAQNAVKLVDVCNRIIKKKPGLGFQKPIHEQLLRENGDAPVIISVDKWKLMHSGYVGDIFEEKMRRNIGILEQAAVNATDAQERHFHHMYLVREYYQLKDMQNCAAHLKRVLSEPEMINRQFKQYGHGLASLAYSLIHAAAALREQISRREIRRKIIEPFKKYMVGYSGTPTIDLFYSCIFDLKEDILLAETGPALAAARKLPASPISYYHTAEAAINHRAAEAEFRRGKFAAAMDYAIESFKNSEDISSGALRVLLGCLRGQPAEEIILFLNSQFDLNNPHKLGALATGTRLDGFRDVHAYYLSKKIDAKIATKGDYLYLLLLLGRHEESVKAALEFCDEANEAVVAQHLMMAAVCSVNERIYRDNADLLGKYSHILDAYFAGGRVQALTEFEIGVLVNVYDILAIAAGIGLADKFMSVFEEQSLLCFQVRVKYCAENGLYDMALQKPAPKPDDYVSNRFIIESLVMTGNCGEAVDKIRLMLSAGNIGEVPLCYLLAAADRSSGALKSSAAALYNEYMPLYDWFIDLTDVLKTGYVYDSIDKKKQKAMAATTYAQFNKQLDEDAAKPKIPGLPELCEQAAAVYEAQNMPAMAMECYRFAVAQGFNAQENRARLAAVFKKLGNYQLAGRIG